MKWLDKFVAKVERYWHWSGVCRHIVWRHTNQGDYHVVEIAPALREIEGGPHDGARVWTPFRFDIKAFCAATNAQVSTVLSAHGNYSVSLKLVLAGKINRKVLLRIRLQPPKEAQVVRQRI